MRRPAVWVLTESLAARRFLEAILAERIQRREIAVDDFLLRSTAIGAAQLSLARDPGQPVALVLSADTTEPCQIEEQRARLRRILDYEACDSHDYHIALAAPHLNAWAMADPRIKAEFEAREDTDPRNSRLTPEDLYINQAVRIRDLVPPVAADRNPNWVVSSTQQPFNVAALTAGVPEFQRLGEFLDRHTATFQEAQAAVASG